MKRILIFLVLAVALLWWALSRVLVPTSAAALVTRGKAVYVVTGSVTVSADAESSLASPAPGIVLVDGFSIAEGKEVKTGDLLARLDPGDIPFQQNTAQAELDQIKGRLAADKKLPTEIQLASAEKEVADAKPLFEHNPQFIAPEAYARLQQTAEEQKALAEKERSELTTNATVQENLLKGYADQLNRRNIVAPYDGFITSVSAHPGDYVALGAPIAGIISSKLKIAAEVNQDDIAAVGEKEKATVTFFAYPGKIFPATVTRVLPSSNAETQRFTVLLEITDPPAPLFAGLTGEVNFSAGEHDNALLIPRRALVGNNVAVVKSGRVEIRQVQVGFLTLTEAEITQGVSEGDVVLTENLEQFRNGDHVRLANNPAEK